MLAIGLLGALLASAGHARAARLHRWSRHQSRGLEEHGFGSRHRKARGIFDTLLSSGRVEIPLTRTGEGWYAATISFANFSARLAVDTGSEVLWARQAAGTSFSGVSASTPRTATTSASPAGWGFLDPHRFSVQYGRGAVKGNVLRENVTLQAHRAARAHACRVGQATQEASFWMRQRTIDGILGLACSDGVPAGSLQCLFPQGEEGEEGLRQRRRVFSLQLRPTSGTLTLGPVPAAYRSSLYFMPPMRRCGHWSVPLLALSSENPGGTDENPLPATLTGASAESWPRDAVLDSGTDGIVGPTFDIMALAHSLGAAPAHAVEGYGGEVTFYKVPCAARITLPPVTLTFGIWGQEANVTLSGKDLVSESTGDGKECHLRLAGWATRSFILGSAFLGRLNAAVFDLDRLAVGLAL